MQGEDELGAAPLAVEADRTDLGVQQGMYPLSVEEVQHGRGALGDELV